MTEAEGDQAFGAAGVDVVFSLGSNMGDRLGYLQAAVDQLRATPGVEVTVISSVYETAPVGGVEQSDFFNIVVGALSSLPARMLLERALGIEQSLDRRRAIRWGPRTVDIDVVTVGDDVSHDEFLTLPHPRAHERAFVLVPWLETDPSARLGGVPVTDLVAVLGDGGVRRCDDVRIR